MEEEEKSQRKEEGTRRIRGKRPRVEEGTQIIGETLTSETVTKDVERDIAPDALGKPIGKHVIINIITGRAELTTIIKRLLILM